MGGRLGGGPDPLPAIAREPDSSTPNSGAAEGTRTPDPRITNALLYQLSYSGGAVPIATGDGRVQSLRRRTNAPISAEANEARRVGV